jgi:hypothetical protein
VTEPYPRRMTLGDLERREEEWARFTVTVGRGTCPWCGFTPVVAEPGSRGYCPSPACARPILAVL